LIIRRKIITQMKGEMRETRKGKTYMKNASTINTYEFEHTETHKGKGKMRISKDQMRL